MSEKEIFQKLKTIVVDQLGVNEENVTKEARLVASFFVGKGNGFLLCVSLNC